MYTYFYVSILSPLARLQFNDANLITSCGSSLYSCPTITPDYSIRMWSIDKVSCTGNITKVGHDWWVLAEPPWDPDGPIRAGTPPFAIVEQTTLNLLHFFRVCAFKMKIERKWMGFRPPFCTHWLNWASRTTWGWWDEGDYTALQTQDSKCEPRRSEAKHASSRSRRLPTLLKLYEWAGKKHFVYLQLKGQSGAPIRDLPAALTTTPWLPPLCVQNSRTSTRNCDFYHRQFVLNKSSLANTTQ